MGLSDPQVLIQFPLERKKGLEPSTFSLATRHSTTELLPLVPSARVELALHRRNKALDLACLPFHHGGWSQRQDSNLRTFSL